MLVQLYMKVLGKYERVKEENKGTTDARVGRARIQRKTIDCKKTHHKKKNKKNSDNIEEMSIQ